MFCGCDGVEVFEVLEFINCWVCFVVGIWVFGFGLKWWWCIGIVVGVWVGGCGVLLLLWGFGCWCWVFCWCCGEGFCC